MNNQKGFGLIELMIAVSVLTIVMLGFAQTMAFQAKSQRGAQTILDVNALTTNLSGIMGAPWSASASLAGNDPNGAIVVKDPVIIGKVIAQESTGTFWSVSKLRLQNIAPIPNQAGYFKGTLFLQVTKNMKLNNGAPVLSYNIADVYFTLDSQGKILQCFNTSTTIAGLQSQCSMLGGTWVSNGISGQCQLSNGQDNQNDDNQDDNDHNQNNQGDNGQNNQGNGISNTAPCDGK